MRPSLPHVIAYVSSALPLIYLSPLKSTPLQPIADIMSITGFLIATWATIDLGKQLGVSPAKRGRRHEGGLYRYCRHPMYLGYAVAQGGWVLINPFNIPLYALSLGLFFVRAREEEKLFRPRGDFI